MPSVTNGVGLVMLSLLSAAVLAAQKPTVKIPIKGHSFRLISSVSDLVAAADAIVLVESMKSDDMSTRSRPKTRYQLKVLDVLKSHGELAEQISVFRPVGTVDGGKQIYDYDDELPPFKPSEQYVLFLKWYPESNGYWIIENGVGGVRTKTPSRDTSEVFTKHAASAAMSNLDYAKLHDLIVRSAKNGR